MCHIQTPYNLNCQLTSSQLCYRLSLQTVLLINVTECALCSTPRGRECQQLFLSYHQYLIKLCAKLYLSHFKYVLNKVINIFINLHILESYTNIHPLTVYGGHVIMRSYINSRKLYNKIYKLTFLLNPYNEKEMPVTKSKVFQVENEQWRHLVLKL